MTGPDLEVVVGDARTSIAAQPTGSYDVVVGDAFGSLAVPWHLTTREMVAEVRRVLRPGGTYVLNVIDNPPNAFAAAEAATLVRGLRRRPQLRRPRAARRPGRRQLRARRERPAGAA